MLLENGFNDCPYKKQCLITQKLDLERSLNQITWAILTIWLHSWTCLYLPNSSHIVS